MNKEEIRKLALENGFKLKQQPNGEMDLNPYVYDFARALMGELRSEIDELDQENMTYFDIITRQRMKLRKLKGIKE